MPADPPPSLLMTPDRRRRLTQLFGEARQLAAQPRPNIRRIHDLLAECVRSDPGNFLYVDALLANLRQRPEANLVQRLWKGIQRTFAGRPAQGSLDAAAGGFDAACRLLQTAPEALWRAPKDAPLLRRLAEAAGECEFDEVESRLLQEARRLAPDDADTLRDVARALTRQGCFEESVGPWHAVAALLPGDREALQAIDDLGQVLRGSSDAEQQLTAAQAARGGDLVLAAERRQLRLEQSAERVALAQKRAEHDSHPRAKTLVQRLKADHLRRRIELLALEAEQSPRDAAVRVELARCLKQAGNYSAAAGTLDEALNLHSQNAAALLELGEVRQHLRQFDQALDCYLRAGSLAGESGGEGDGEETRLLAHYRAGILASALGKTQLARIQFDLISQVRPEYRDTQQQLARLVPS